MHPSLQFPFFSTFFKKEPKKQSKTGVPMMLASMANVVLGGIFSETPKIKCQTTGRPRTCPPYHFLSTKRDYNPKKKERTRLFCALQNACASRNKMYKQWSLAVCVAEC